MPDFPNVVHILVFSRQIGLGVKSPKRMVKKGRQKTYLKPKPRTICLENVNNMTKILMYANLSFCFQNQNIKRRLKGGLSRAKPH